jgi:L-asparaginase II
MGRYGVSCGGLNRKTFLIAAAARDGASRAVFQLFIHLAQFLSQNLFKICATFFSQNY